MIEPLVTAGMLEDADALSMSRDCIVVIVDGAGILRKQGLQEIVANIGNNLLTDEAETD